MADDSKAGEVGARYALALFDLAKEQNQIPAVESDLKTLKGMIAESRDFLTQAPWIGLAPGLCLCLLL